MSRPGSLLRAAGPLSNCSRGNAFGRQAQTCSVHSDCPQQSTCFPISMQHNPSSRELRPKRSHSFVPSHSCLAHLQPHLSPVGRLSAWPLHPAPCSHARQPSTTQAGDAVLASTAFLPRPFPGLDTSDRDVKSAGPSPLQPLAGVAGLSELPQGPHGTRTQRSCSWLPALTGALPSQVSQATSP